VWSLSRQFLGNDADAEEAVQDVFVALWKDAATFDPSIAGEATFVAMIARRRLIDTRRRLGRRPESELLHDDDPALAHDGARAMEASAETQRVLGVLDTMRGEQRRVIQLSAGYGLSHGAIAKETGLPLGTVKSHLKRGLEQVRAVLGASRDGLSDG